MLFRSNETYFALDASLCTMGVAEADMKLSEAQYALALKEQTAQKKEFPDLSSTAITAAFPGRCQSLNQVLSTSDARLNSLSHPS